MHHGVYAGRNGWQNLRKQDRKTGGPPAASHLCAPCGGGNSISYSAHSRRLPRQKIARPRCTLALCLNFIRYYVHFCAVLPPINNGYIPHKVVVPISLYFAAIIPIVKNTIQQYCYPLDPYHVIALLFYHRHVVTPKSKYHINVTKCDQTLRHHSAHSAHH